MEHTCLCEHPTIRCDHLGCRCTWCGGFEDPFRTKDQPIAIEEAVSQGRIINLLGGPCSGKSTWRAGLFFHMKRRGIDCEEVIEWVKGPVWEGRHATIKSQPYVFGKQLMSMERVVGKVDVVITDSPVLLSYYYGQKYATHYSASLYQGMVDEFKRLGGLNVWLDRVGTYNPKGRMQTEAEADAVADEMRQMLVDLNIPFTRFKADQDEAILNHCLEYVNGE